MPCPYNRIQFGTLLEVASMSQYQNGETSERLQPKHMFILAFSICCMISFFRICVSDVFVR